MKKKKETFEPEAMRCSEFEDRVRGIAELSNELVSEFGFVGTAVFVMGAKNESVLWTDASRVWFSRCVIFFNYVAKSE